MSEMEKKMNIAKKKASFGSHVLYTETVKTGLTGLK